MTYDTLQSSGSDSERKLFKLDNRNFDRSPPRSRQSDPKLHNRKYLMMFGHFTRRKVSDWERLPRRGAPRSSWPAPPPPCSPPGRQTRPRPPPPPCRGSRPSRCGTRPRPSPSRPCSRRGRRRAGLPSLRRRVSGRCRRGQNQRSRRSQTCGRRGPQASRPLPSRQRGYSRAGNRSPSLPSPPPRSAPQTLPCLSCSL